MYDSIYDLLNSLEFESLDKVKQYLLDRGITENELKIFDNSIHLSDDIKKSITFEKDGNYKLTKIAIEYLQENKNFAPYLGRGNSFKEANKSLREESNLPIKNTEIRYQCIVNDKHQGKKTYPYKSALESALGDLKKTEIDTLEIIATGPHTDKPVRADIKFKPTPAGAAPTRSYTTLTDLF